VGLALTDVIRTPRQQAAPGVTHVAPDAFAQRARTHLTGYLDGMPREDHGVQHARRALAEMGLAQLRVMERTGYSTREPPVTITPLRKLWIAWKHRRR